MNRALALALASLVACSVPALELGDKRCPCVAGYTCDVATDTCVSDGADASDANGDGPPPSCFTGTPGALLYGNAFAGGGFQWTEPLGDWSIQNGEARQGDGGLPVAFAYPPQTAAETDYFVSAKARQLAGAGTASVGLALRVQSGTSGHYSCSWEPNTGNFVMQHTSTDGLTVSPIASIAVNLSTIPNYSAANPQILDVKVEGANLQCCVRDVPAARLSMDDTRYPTGGPGFRTASMSAAFDDLTINALP